MTNTAGRASRTRKVAAAPEPPRPLMDTEQVAEYLGVKPGTVKSWRRDLSGPRYVYVGQLVRYRPSDVEAWLDRNAIDERSA